MIFNLVFYLMKLIDAYQMVLVVYALLSWFPNARGSKIEEWVSKLSEPYLNIFDRFIPPIGGIIFNVIIAIFTLNLVKRCIIVLLNLFL